MVAGLAVPGCEGPSSVVKSPTYAVLSRNQLCRELRTRWGGGSQKVTNDGEGEGGVTIPPKNDDVIYEQPLIHWAKLSSYVQEQTILVIYFPV